MLVNISLTLFRMGIFDAANGGCGGEPKSPNPPPPKICRRYSAIMKLRIIMLYLKEYRYRLDFNT